MPDYSSAFTGQQIDSAIGAVTDAGGSVTGRLSGSGAPTVGTAARVGDLYTDTSENGKMYRCIRVSGGVYTWDVVGSGDGVSPEAEVERITGGAKITITDSRGTTTANLYDGTSPTASVERVEGGVDLTVTDAEGTTTETLYDGVSPSASVEEVDGGAEITITDRDGTSTALVHNGYHVGSIAMTSGSTAPGQTAIYTVYLNDDDDNPTAVGTFSVYNGINGTGAGDMTKAVYDTNDSGVVDNAERLGGNLPAHYAAAEDVPTKVSELTNDAGYITDEDVPTAVSELTNDAEYITAEDVPDIVPAWAMESTKPTYTASEVGAITSADIVGKQDKPSEITTLPTSGTALNDNTIYKIPASAPVSTYQFIPPVNGGWAHGYFTTGSSVSITFSAGSEFSPEEPTFEALTKYQFDVDDGIWMFTEVITS